MNKRGLERAGAGNLNSPDIQSGSSHTSTRSMCATLLEKSSILLGILAAVMAPVEQ
jgi:hypothetical protein